MEKTKIIYIITKSNWGGAQKNLFELATALPKETYEVSALVGEKGELLNKLLSENIPVYPTEDLGRDMRMTKDVISFIKIFKKIKNLAPDIVHLHSPKAGGLGAFASRLLGVKKIIYTVHGGTWNEDRSHFQKNVIKIFSWLTMLFCHKVIILSQKEYLQVESWYFSKLIKKKLVVIPIGIKNIDFISKDEARAEIEKLVGSARPGPAVENFLIGSIGELHKNKGYEYAIEALSAISFPFKYFIVGGGEERKNLEKIIHEKKMENKVILLGNIPSASRLLKAFDVFLLSSVKEGLPYVLLEAGLAGIPIVATNVGGIPDIFINTQDGALIDSKNPKKINEALLEIKNDSKKAEEVALSFQEKVAEKYSFQKMVMHTLDVYSKKI